MAALLCNFHALAHVLFIEERQLGCEVLTSLHSASISRWMACATIKQPAKNIDISLHKELVITHAKQGKHMPQP